MLTIARTKELLEDTSLSDEGAREIRDGLYNLAEIALESWQNLQLAKSKNLCYNKNVDPV